jgi:hypothetical protein
MATSDFDPYEVLGVRQGASEEEIRAAYKEQAARYHPDKHRGNPLEPLAVEKLRDINRARDMLLRDPPRWGGARRGAEGGESARASGSSTPARSAGSELVSWLGGTVGTILGVLFLLRFGVVFIREIFMVLRAAMMGVLWVLRISPIFVIALMIGIAMLTGYWLKARHRER